MGWYNLENTKKASSEEKSAREDAYRVLAAAASKALAGGAQEPLNKFLRNKANSISYRAGATSAEVAFEEGQRSLALQILKLAGEI